MPEYIERSETAEFFEKSKQTMWHKDDIAATISSKSNVPAADVAEVVHGHWKGIELKDTCSVCNRSISEICDADSYIEIEVLSELIACPFCGAKMDGKGD